MPDSSARRELIPQPHGGALAPYRPGESGNPSGFPAGYVDAASAMRLLATFSREVVAGIADGTFPPEWERPKAMQYTRCARALLASMDGDKATDRMDGPVATKTQVTGANDGPIEYRPVDVK